MEWNHLGSNQGSDHLIISYLGLSIILHEILIPLRNPPALQVVIYLAAMQMH